MPFNSRLLIDSARTAIALLMATLVAPATAQELLFDGGFESGTFQGWTPGGNNGASALIAAKNSCYSSNDTTGISFNGDPANNFAALLRSNAAGDKTSVARLRSANFPAGRGILFSALSETSDANPSDDPSDLTVRILDSEGKVLSALPVETAVVRLAVGCPSVKRDTAFAVHYIDTSQHNGEISVEFSQHTNKSGFAYFTLIDNVVRVEKDQVFVNQSLPVARAGTGLTSSGILYLDPRDSYDPDNSPFPLDYSWFINGEGSVRYKDIPCVNVNSDFELGPGNHIATLYVTDGFNYAADTIRFPVTSGQTIDEIPATSEEGITLTTPKGDPIVREVNLVSEDGITQTDPLEECDVDVAEGTDEDTSGGDSGDGSEGPSIDVDANSDSTFDNTFTVGSSAVDITSNNVDVSSANGETVARITVTITNASSGDSLTIGDNPSEELVVNNSGSSSVSIEPDENADSVSDSEFEDVLEAIQFSYTVPDGQDANTSQRNILYTVSDEAGNSASTNSTVTVEN